MLSARSARTQGTSSGTYLKGLAQGHMQQPLEAGHHAHALAPHLIQHAPNLRLHQLRKQICIQVLDLFKHKRSSTETLHVASAAYCEPLMASTDDKQHERT